MDEAKVASRVVALSWLLAVIHIQKRAAPAAGHSVGEYRVMIQASHLPPSPTTYTRGQCVYT